MATNKENIDEKQIAPENTKLKKKSSFSDMDNDRIVLYFGVTVLGSIAIPFVYYSIVVNAHGTSNKPEGFNFPHICDFWRVLVGAICTQIFKSFATNAFKSSFYNYVKGDTDELKMRYQTKAAEHIGQLSYLTFFSVWGYYELK